MKTTRILFSLPILSLYVWMAGCATNPVSNSTCVYSSGTAMAEYAPPDKHLHERYPAIIDDYQNFIVKTKGEHPTWWTYSVAIYEDKGGQHAVKLVFETGTRTYTDFFLMYDKSNTRIQVIKGDTTHASH